MIAAADVFDGVAIVLELHEADGRPTPYCKECGHASPCPTARALGVTS